jgi:4-carboxymuconolactone decarboxylase
VERAQLELLRRLALGDPNTTHLLLCGQAIEPPLLNERTSALVRLAALAAVGGSVAAYQAAVDAALASGAEEDQTVDVVFAVAPIIGLARVNTAARALATALGCDLDERR